MKTQVFTPLTENQLQTIDGGILCAGLCIAGVVAGGFVVGAALTATAMWLIS